MKIAVLGAGAMGMLFGSFLSRQNDVRLVEINRERVEQINREGILIREKDGEWTAFPKAVSDTAGLGAADLVLIFVKAMFTEAALQANRGLIGPETRLMTLQNGAGHEKKLLPFADAGHIIIGSTQHNSSVTGSREILHGGSGLTSIGLLEGEAGQLNEIAENFTACGLECVTSGDVKKQIWNKLFTNTAASALTAVLQVPLGYLVENEAAHELMITLCREAVAVANAEGFAHFDEAEVISGVETVCRNAPRGYTSIYADIRDGRRTEVDTISGSVVQAALSLGVPVPCHEMLVRLIHALEGRTAAK